MTRENIKKKYQEASWNFAKTIVHKIVSSKDQLNTPDGQRALMLLLFDLQNKICESCFESGVLYKENKQIPVRDLRDVLTGNEPISAFTKDKKCFS